MGTILKFVLFAFVSSQSAFAAELVGNCFERESVNQFFFHDLGEMHESGAFPVLLLSEKNEVVGVISVTPHLGAKKVVDVHSVELCGSLEASEFLYTDEISGNLLKWTTGEGFWITQDEGLLSVSVGAVRKEEYAVRIDIEYMAYDVFDEEADSPENEKKPDYLVGYGVPRAKGKFHFYVPSNWY